MGHWYPEAAMARHHVNGNDIKEKDRGTGKRNEMDSVRTEDILKVVLSTLQSNLVNWTTG